jgi:hypothetical protein
MSNGTEPKNIGWGTGAQTSSANSDVNLFNPGSEARTSGGSTQTTTSYLADTYLVTGSITAAGAKTITEAALFDSSASSPTTTLAATVTSAAQTAFSLGAATGPTTGNYYAQIANEVVLVTGGQNTTSITVVRGRLGSTAAASYAVGAIFTPGGDGGAKAFGGVGEQTSTTVVGGSMFAHSDFAGVAVALNDSINFSFKGQFA